MLKRLNCRFVILMLVTSFVTGGIVVAEDVVFPRRAEAVIDVVKKYNIDNTGATDVTNKLQRAMNENQAWDVLYLPKGTYLVSNTISGKIANRGVSSFGPILTGESRTETVIKLKDGTWPKDAIDIRSFPRNTTEQVVLHSGDCTNTTFKKVFRNFTVNIGKNNAGAIGMVFIASNTGIVADVDIISEDGQGSIGLALTGVENGPSSARSVHVKGFNVGVYARTGVMMSMSQITIEGATRYGFVNKWNCAVDSLLIRTSGRAVLNNANGRLSIVNGRFYGTGGDSIAVENWGKMYFRNIHVNGFDRFHNEPVYRQNTPPSGTIIKEYVTHANDGLFHAPGKSIGLPVEYPTFPRRETDLSKWANVDSYKASGVTDEQAMMKAFKEQGVTSVFFPNSGLNRLREDITLPGKVGWVEGGGGKILGGRQIGTLTIGDGSAPTVVFRNMDMRNHADRKSIGFVINTDRTVILESVYANVTIKGTGKVFIYDLLGSIEVDNPNARVWVRKVNKEYGGGIVVKRGTLWVLGYKSEGFQPKPKLDVHAGGTCELIGFLNYNCGNKIPDNFKQALFKVTNGNLSVANLLQVSCNSPSYDNIVIETRNGETRTYTTDMVTQQGGMTLYTGYEPDNLASGTSPETTRFRNGLPGIATVSRTGRQYSLTLRNQNIADDQRISITDARGRSYELPVKRTVSGIVELDFSSVAAGVYTLIVRTNRTTHKARVVVP